MFLTEWTIAEYVGESEPKALQRFLNVSPWVVDDLLELNRDYVMEHLASPAAILVADPTGFAKKGTKSVGVQRQYSGTLGRIDNCQIATFLGYVTPEHDRALLDPRLYLPEVSWLADPDRCAEAGVPADTTFKTRPEQVIEMIEAARTAGVPFAWFTADEEFGQNPPGLREYLEKSGISYVMAIPKNTLHTDTRGQEIQLKNLVPDHPAPGTEPRSPGSDIGGCRRQPPVLADRPVLGHRGPDGGRSGRKRAIGSRVIRSGEARPLRHGTVDECLRAAAVIPR